MVPITPIELLEEADRELARAQGRVLTALAHLKIEKRERLVKTLKPEIIEEKSFMPSSEAVKQFLAGTIVPLITGGLVTWLAGTNVLSLLHISTTGAAATISSVILFGVSYGLTWLTSHHILSSHYPPAAKAKAGK